MSVAVHGHLVIVRGAGCKISDGQKRVGQDIFHLINT